MLFNTLIILKALRVSYNIDYIFLQRRHIILKPLEEAVHIGFVGGLRLNYTTLGLYPLIPPR